MGFYKTNLYLSSEHAIDQLQDFSGTNCLLDLNLQLRLN